MSLWNQINNAKAIKTGELTHEQIEVFMRDLQIQSSKDAEEREFVMHTGEGGWRMIQNSMQASVYLNLMKDLNFSREERKRLGKMIKSPDRENFEIAKILIDNKMKEAKEFHK